MKPFNLEEAKQGKSVITRDGKEVRIICFDRDEQNYPIVALIKTENYEEIQAYTIDGHFWDSSRGYVSKFDLMMKGEKREGWVNLYKFGNDEAKVDSIIRSSKEVALAAVSKSVGGSYIDTIKIEWEE